MSERRLTYAAANPDADEDVCFVCGDPNVHMQGRCRRCAYAADLCDENGRPDYGEAR